MMLTSLALIVSFANATVPLPQATKTPMVVAHASPRTTASPRPGPRVVPDEICRAIMQRAGLTTVSRDNPLKYLTAEGALFTAAMKGHVGDPDLGGASVEQIELVTQSRGVIELFGSGPRTEFPQGVIGCMGRYR